MTTHLTLLRHGQPECRDLLLGRTDPPLTPRGWAQLKAQVRTLAFDAIESSPQRRCCQFAEALAQQRHLPLTIKAEWAEMDFGQWDGKALTELWQQEDFLLYQQDPFAISPPDGESMQQLQARIIQAVTQCAQDYPQQRVLVVTHSGVMRAVLAWLFDQPCGNPHLRRVLLDHAGYLELELYLDERGELWPRLSGFQSGGSLPHAVQHEQE